MIGNKLNLEPFSVCVEKNKIFGHISEYLNKHQIDTVTTDQRRPWGGFFVISDNSLQTFASLFFPDITISDYAGLKLSPKILVVKPGERLSWQYHNRRSEIWTIVSGEVGIVISNDDALTPVKIFKPGDTISIEKGTRHRAEGLKEWGIIAEIWQHTYVDDPSDEEDIIRIQDDYGR